MFNSQYVNISYIVMSILVTKTNVNESVYSSSSVE